MIKVRKSRTNNVLNHLMMVWNERSPTVVVMNRMFLPQPASPLIIQAMSQPRRWCISLVVSNDDVIKVDYIQLGKAYRHIDLVDWLKDQHEQLLKEVDSPQEALWVITTRPHELTMEDLVRLGA